MSETKPSELGACFGKEEEEEEDGEEGEGGEREGSMQTTAWALRKGRVETGAGAEVEGTTVFAEVPASASVSADTGVLFQMSR